MGLLKPFSSLIRLTRSMSSYLVPPSAVRGMKTLDRDAFTKSFEIPCLRIPSQVAFIPSVVNVLKENTLKIRKLKSIQRIDEDKSKIIYLDPDHISTWDDIIDEEKVLQQHGLSRDNFSRTNVTLDWDNWTPQVIMHSVMGESGVSVTGFSQIGHIIHLNLRPEHEEYKQLIGEVFLEKIPTCRTVLNKTNIIENEFRNISYEVLAGPDDLKTVTRESGCMFHLDYGQVYWNPRLSTEHERLVAEVQSSDVLYDVFAGIGPFAIPAGKKKCTALANDLNPISYEYLVKNIAANKVGNYVKPFNLDGREFIRTVMKDDMLLRWTANPSASLLIVMNLPALAEEFIDVFKGLLSSVAGQIRQNLPVSTPTVHLYCFDKADDPRGPPLDRLDRNLGWTLDRSTVKRHFVRIVAPNKDMIRLVFNLPWDLLTDADGLGAEKRPGNDEQVASDEAAPDSKRRKILEI